MIRLEDKLPVLGIVLGRVREGEDHEADIGLRMTETKSQTSGSERHQRVVLDARVEDDVEPSEPNSSRGASRACPTLAPRGTPKLATPS